MKISRAFRALLLGLAAPAVLFAEAPKPAIDPQALAPLKRMSATLAGAQALTFRSETAFEVPAATGQFLTLFSAGEIALKRPDKLRARLAGEAPHFDFFYDGKTVSAYAPGTKVYSVVPAPATVDEMLAGLEAETGIRFATAPLLFGDPYSVLTRDLQSAIVVGSTRIDGVPCDHLAFRSPGVNWEIWLEADARSLPRRLAVTFTDRVNFPRTLVRFSRWNLRPWLGDGGFVFRAPPGTREIPFGSVLEAADRKP